MKWHNLRVVGAKDNPISLEYAIGSYNVIVVEWQFAPSIQLNMLMIINRFSSTCL
jgi:hypothetical protein